jgi:hypothetical protein
LKAPARDPALDAVRGLLQIFILCSHAFGSYTSTHLIHAAWGLSDSSEQFVLLSGFGLGSVFLYRQARGGFGAAVADLARRWWLLWRLHVLVFVLLALLVTTAAQALGEPGWPWLVERPLAALLAGAATLYQPPPFTGVLSLFLYGMATLPLFSAALDRFGARALVLPAALWTLAQLLPPDIPALGGTTIAFHPLAWVPLFWLGAFLGRRALIEGRAVGRHRGLVAASLAMLALGAAMRLGEVLPLWLTGKEQLAPLRLLHALACAYLVAALLPRAALARARWAAPLATIGRHSLPVFCVGLFCSAVTVLVLRHAGLPQAIAEPAMLGLSAWLVWRLAVFLDRRRGG